MEVRDGVVFRTEWTSAWWSEYPEYIVPVPEGFTVEELFAFIRRRADSESVCEMEVQYDAKLGVPLRISTEGPSDVTDTAWGRRVRDFRVLE